MDGIKKMIFSSYGAAAYTTGSIPRHTYQSHGLCAKRDDIKLYFMGIKHPNPEVRELSMVNDTVNLANKLGLTGKNVFFNFGWVPYEERHNYFLSQMRASSRIRSI
jgi:hypothetical protein